MLLEGSGIAPGRVIGGFLFIVIMDMVMVVFDSCKLLIRIIYVIANQKNSLLLSIESNT